ncbi:hypothetical protein C3374_20050 [Pantoea sp. PSNIH4]|nr:hypothetical protein PSNIH2_13540 [Pantoea sp. PSNIH2]POU49612.1 hypothetical protein C3380_08520 [Pantoea sp. PSNIH5]POU62331.1 hypothetical protein C3374_20050 [Pantoea sp. PSNIH4]POY66296.1 hypothetical protein C3402_18590 [Pantoea sp. PSNIH3]
MDNQDNELMKVVQELADEEGISFSDACNVAIRALKYEFHRRAKFNSKAACGESQTLGNTHDQASA